jgi:signal transduction histidine kinase
LESSALQAQRAGQVMRELLLFLQKSESSIELVDLNDAAHRALAIIEADGYGFRTTLELAAELKPVVANRLQVEKVMVNLLRNSLEAMRNAGVSGKHIAIRTAADGSVAHVTIRDNGPGLNRETASQIFEPFFTTKPTGLGMGLTISRTLIEAHGGKLWSEIKPAPGATFHFTLPFST